MKLISIRCRKPVLLPDFSASPTSFEENHHPPYDITKIGDVVVVSCSEWGGKALVIPLSEVESAHASLDAVTAPPAAQKR